MEMRGAMYHGLHHVTLETFEKPEPTPDGIVVKNVRSGICGTDLHAYEINGPEVGIYPGNQFGHEMSGIVYEVGANVTDFQVGERVFVNPVTFRVPTEDMSVLMSCDMAGAFSEYIRVDAPKSEYNIFKLSDDLSWDIAALTEPVSVTLNGILKCRPKPGDKVIIYGGGIIGLCALACFKCLGISDVIVTARNPYRCAKVQEMGGILCDTTRTTVPDFAKSCWGTLTGNNGEDTWNADIVVDCAGYPGSFSEILRYAKCGSQIAIISLGTSTEHLVENDLCCKDASIHGSFAYTPAVNRRAIDIMTENQDVFAPIITSSYDLSEIAEAFEAAADHQKNVKVLIHL
ncbi:MAG: alcohol dehydrogenase catalytic domain-containing protein [Eubacterium sp.]|nr:alcohol dehydrogenase catalytic domain-containing protein [Eubacterium sp.]